ncbi:MAG TPA: hypothetical protein DCX53_15155 [Anaerolineae bacterium]|nr:hypothetical protein [Anaerolineae bacterium]
MKNNLITLTFIISLVLASCTSSQSAVENEDQSPMEPQAPPMTDETQTSSENPLPIPTQQSFPDPASAPVEKYVALAKLDLANFLQVDVELISLVDATEMTWPDSAIGCPAPGKVYAQGKVPGHRILLNAGDVEYTYHTDLLGQIVYCPEDTLGTDDPLSIPATGPTPHIGVPID